MRALELAGRVVDPSFQGESIGSTMLSNSIQEFNPTHLATYTRNPAVLKMIAGVSESIYPIREDDELRELALEMPYASDHGAVYHTGRYPEEGLFRGIDPADSPYETKGASLKESFPLLISARNTLVVVSRLRKDVA